MEEALQEEPPASDHAQPRKLVRRAHRERRFGGGSRRSGVDRRQVIGNGGGEDHRSHLERRSEEDRRAEEDRRSGVDRRAERQADAQAPAVEAPPSEALSRLIRHLLVILAICFSTAVAWLLYELGSGTRFGSIVYEIWRGVKRFGRMIADMEPIVAAIVFPLVVFPILAIGYFLYHRDRSD